MRKLFVTIFLLTASSTYAAELSREEAYKLVSEISLDSRTYFIPIKEYTVGFITNQERYASAVYEFITGDDEFAERMRNAVDNPAAKEIQDHLNTLDIFRMANQAGAIFVQLRIEETMFGMPSRVYLTVFPTFSAEGNPVHCLKEYLPEKCMMVLGNSYYKEVTGISGQGNERLVEVSLVEEATEVGSVFGMMPIQETKEYLNFVLFDDGWRVLE